MLRTRKPLSCFYCGKRSGAYFDPAKRQFDCKHCDATNYLDKVSLLPSLKLPPFVWLMCCRPEWRH